MSRAASARLLLAGACVALLAGCAHRAQPPLYMWEKFPRQQYDTLLAHGAPPLSQIEEMEAHIEKARSKNAALPPGFRAHLGLLKLSAGDAARARDLWLEEKLAFPESAPYMDQLLKRLDGPAKVEKSA